MQVSLNNLVDTNNNNNDDDNNNDNNNLNSFKCNVELQCRLPNHEEWFLYLRSKIIFCSTIIINTIPITKKKKKTSTLTRIDGKPWKIKASLDSYMFE